MDEDVLRLLRAAVQYVEGREGKKTQAVKAERYRELKSAVAEVQGRRHAPAR